jgi:hypothetical protein
MAAQVVAEAAEVLHLLALVLAYNHLMIPHMVQKLHPEHPVDMVILAVPGIPQYQELIQPEQLGQEGAARAIEADPVQILQVAQENLIE